MFLIQGGPCQVQLRVRNSLLYSDKRPGQPRLVDAGWLFPALLAAGWLRVLPLDTPELRDTIEFLSNVLHHNGGILSMGGAHIAKTGMWLALQKTSEPSIDAVSILAGFGSSTGHYAVQHKSKGALEEGDSLLSAAIFVFMVLDDMVMTKDGLKLGGLIRRAHELPTPLGKIDILDGSVQQRARRK